MSEMPNARELASLKDLMLEQLQELEVEILSHVAATRPIAPDNAIGRLTRMEAIQAKSISEASLRSARARVTRLEAALARMDSSGFGICARCEEPIPIKRLMLLPETTRCVSCMEG